MKNFWEKPDLLIRTGSRLYGCSTPSSDDDLRGFVVEPAHCFLGRNKFDQHEDKVNDVVIWGLVKFLNQLVRGTPNTFEILFAPESHILTCSENGRIVLDSKEMFVTKSQLMPFSGFAMSEWLKAQLKTKNRETGDIYHSSRVVGAKRKESYSKYGYSVKNAYHAVRLLSQGIELAETGSMTFPRPEADLLVDIRNGKLSFDLVEKEVKRLDAKLLFAMENNDLSEELDQEEVNEMYYRIIADDVVEFLKERQS